MKFAVWAGAVLVACAVMAVAQTNEEVKLLPAGADIPRMVSPAMHSLNIVNELMTHHTRERQAYGESAAGL